ncbi:MAG: hypothetical protein DMF69_22980 [Acidobacteria bacterium]|nr:MAG: hypothetical protein DMF69_22980 [Acidobacteriota bacterium]
MKQTLLVVAILALSISVYGQRTAPPKQILHDFRVDSSTSPTKIPSATQRLVLAKVFRKYLTDANKCNPRFEGDLAAARNAGQIAPSVIDSTTGSFTATGQTQTAYVISVAECNASHADNFGSDRLAIFNGQQLVANIDLDFKSSIVRKTDLDGDGIDELLMTSGYMNQGTLTESAALLSFQNGKMQVVADFETVTEDSCASGFPGSTAQASVISIVAAMPGKMPKLQQDNYAAGCSKTKRWKFVSKGKMEQ